MVKIREATLKDAARIREELLSAIEQTDKEDFDDGGWESTVAANSLTETLARIVSKDFLILLAELDGEIVGVIAIKNYRVIFQLFVLEQARRKKIATALWAEAKRYCFENGNNGFYEVNSSTMAVPLYQRFGFEISGDRESRDGVSWYPMELHEAHKV